MSPACRPRGGSKAIRASATYGLSPTLAFVFAEYPPKVQLFRSSINEFDCSLSSGGPWK